MSIRKRKSAWWTRAVLSIVLAALALPLIAPLLRGESPLALGLDLAGGVIVTYRPDLDSRRVGHEDLDDDTLLALAKETLASRLYRTMSTVPEVVVRGDGHLMVSIPAVRDHRAVLELVGKTYHLSLRLVEGAYDEPGEGVPRHAYGGRYLALAPARFTGDMLDAAAIRVAPANELADPSAKVAFAFRPPHDRAFADFTREHTGRTLAILLDDEVEWAGVIEGEIRGSGLLAGGYTAEEAADIVRMLRAGTLPIGLEVASIAAIGPSLGQEVRGRGLEALAVAAAALVALVALAYGHRRALLLAGLVSLATLLFLIAALAALFGLTLDLVGIAGVVLSVGMGMDAFILVFEALEAKRRKPGEPARPGIAAALVRARYSFAGEGRTLLHANATTLAVTALLLTSERLRSFALFIAVGILASVLTIAVTRTVLLASASTGGLAVPGGPDGPLGWLRRVRPRLFRLRGVYAAALVALLAGSAIALGLGVERPALGLGADFRPGTQLVVEAETPAALEAGIDALEARFPGLAVRQQRLGAEDGGRTLLTLDAVVDLSPVAPEAGARSPGRPSADALLATLAAAGVGVEGLETISGRVSATRTAQSLSVLVLSFLMLGLYVLAIQEPLARLLSPRVRVTTPLAARATVLVGILIAVAVDVAAALLALAWLAIPVDLPVVAALLTVIGYSVNDSVVLWSHVEARWAAARRAGGRPAPLAVVTRSVDAILARACLTSVSTMVPALAILALGLEPLRGFAWAMIAGTVAGTVSSLFVVGAFARRALERESRARAPAPVAGARSSPANQSL